MLIDLDDEHTKCTICTNKFSCDINNTNLEIRKHLPVLSSSQRCDHWFCHGCILKEQLRVAQENNGRLPKWIKCMICREKTSFNPAEPKYHRLLIDLLGRAQTFAAAQVKAEEHRVKIESDQVGTELIKHENEFNFTGNLEKDCYNGFSVSTGNDNGNEAVAVDGDKGIKDKEERLVVERPTLIMPSVSCHGDGEIRVKEEANNECDIQDAPRDNVASDEDRQMECAVSNEILTRSETLIKLEEKGTISIDEELEPKLKRRKWLMTQSAVELQIEDESAEDGISTDSPQNPAQDDAPDTYAADLMNSQSHSPNIISLQVSSPSSRVGFATTSSPSITHTHVHDQKGSDNDEKKRRKEASTHDSTSHLKIVLCSSCKICKEIECFTSKQRQLGECARCKDCTQKDEQNKVEILLCSICKVSKELTYFSNKQRKQGVNAKCKECNKQERHEYCSNCKRDKPLDCFSTSQMQRRKELRKCRICVEESYRRCSVCNISKKIGLFTNEQLQLGDAACCYPCLSNLQKCSFCNTSSKKRREPCINCFSRLAKADPQNTSYQDMLVGFGAMCDKLRTIEKRKRPLHQT